jgi:cytochrome c-type biogenesis protein
MELVLAYLAGLLTLINPCVLPVLPLVVGAAVQSHRHAALALALGMGAAFVAAGMTLATFGQAIGLDERTLSTVGALMMVGFGLILMTPRLAHGFEYAMAGIAGRADAGMSGIQSGGLGGQFLGGALLGVVWSPCIGPTLGGAIALAAQGESLAHAAAVMTAFAAGTGTLIVALGYGARNLILRNRAHLGALARNARPVMGVLFALVGLAILFDWTRIAESRLLDIMPYWLQDLSVRY